MHTSAHPDHLSEAQVRHLLFDKMIALRKKRLSYFHRTGRLARQGAELEDFNPGYYPVSSGSSNQSITGKQRDGWSSQILLFVEVAAILGVILVVIGSFQAISSINQKAVLELALPPLTPTPLVRAIVLPSGHIPPDSAGRTAPNNAEIPDHLLPLAQSIATFPTPTPAIEQGIRIQIPALEVDAPIVQGDGWEQLKKGAAQHLGSANPGQRGNMVLTGHNDVYGEIFRHLDRLKPGDEVTIYSSVKAYTYVVKGWTLVDPDQVEVMDPTPDATLTLISCYPYLIDTQRIIVRAQLAGT